MTNLSANKSAAAPARGEIASPAPLLGLLFMLLAGSAFGAEGFTVGLGVDYSTGLYGDSVATDILFVPFLLKWEHEPWTVKLSMPYVEIEGPGGVVLNGENPISTASDSRTTTRQSGLGDTTLSVGRALWTSTGGGIATELTGKIKFPTADESRGLGTGKPDAALTLDAYGAVGKMTLFSGVGYRWMGDPAGVSYRNVWLGNGGFSLKLHPAASIGLLYDYRQSVRAGTVAASEVTPFAAFKFRTHLKLQWYATFGLSSASADRGMGLVLQRTF